MNNLTAFGSAIGSLKTAADLEKAFLNVKRAVDIQGKVFELQGVILAAQQDTFAAQDVQYALLQRVCELEMQIADLESWDLT